MHVAEDDDYRQTLTDREELRRDAAGQQREPVAWVEDLDASGVRARLYVPAGADDRDPWARGVIVHLHGGGFVFHDVDTHDGPARRLANRTGRSVLSVDYRLAPEHPFPAAVHDADHAVAWAASQTRTVIVHGDSAGGNLALVAALRNPGLVSAVVLVYPFLDPASEQASYQVQDWTWDRDEAQWYWSQYLDLAADPTLIAHPDAAPLHAPGLAALPPTLVITAEADIARDEGELLAQRLQELGVTTVAQRFGGVPHGFWRSLDFRREGDLARAATGAFLDDVLDRS
ncbi:alpha/beta hydrolase [Nocardioides sp.]|uniref:alpha/beta hydrolase n=1 Tax=Nocardioides sp. TaxID=35761 RepID=UPI0026251ADB|nr:alpha/beta hydrolase [Nocardioides sp.]